MMKRMKLEAVRLTESDMGGREKGRERVIEMKDERQKRNRTSGKESSRTDRWTQCTDRSDGQTDRRTEL